MKVDASELSDLKIEQSKLSFLANEDLTKLAFFSEYDIYYDRKLYYNPEVRTLIEKYTAAEKHCEKSNVSVAYYEYKNILKDMKKDDFYYMTAAYKLTEIGFFSLAHYAMMKVEDKEIWEKHINFIRKHRFPNTNPSVTEEVFFAGLLSDIVYNNMTGESLSALEKNKAGNINSDYTEYLRAKVFYSDKEYKSALFHINKALSKNQGNFIYKKFKAEILDAAGKETEALKTVKEIQNEKLFFIDIQKDLDKIKYHALSKTEKNEFKQKYYLAYYFYLNKDYQRAINELNLLILKGENKKAPELLGKIYLITEKYDEALNLYTKILYKNDKSAFAHKGLGDIYLKNQNCAKALEEYQKAYKNDSRNFDILTNLTIVSFKMKDEKSAKKYLSKLEKINPDNYKVLYLKSTILQDTGKQNLKASICQNPFFSGGWLDMARDAMEMNDINSAEEYINTAAFITKKDARYFYYKSLLNASKRDFKTAKTDILRAKELVEENTMSKRKINEQL